MAKGKRKGRGGQTGTGSGSNAPPGGPAEPQRSEGSSGSGQQGVPGTPAQAAKLQPPVAEEFPALGQPSGPSHPARPSGTQSAPLKSLAGPSGTPPGFAHAAGLSGMPPGFAHAAGPGGTQSGPSNVAGPSDMPPGFAHAAGSSGTPPGLSNVAGPSSTASGPSNVAGPSGTSASSASSQAIVAGASGLSLVGPQSGVSSRYIGPPRRPGVGRLGKPVQLLANHFKVTIPGMERMNIYHYDVAIQQLGSGSRPIPRAITRPILRQVVAENQARFGGTSQRPARVAYDGSKSLYSSRDLTFAEHECETVLAEEEQAGARGGGGGGGAERQGRERRFKVTIKRVGVYALDALARYLAGQQLTIPQEIIQALDLSLREAPLLKFVPVGRSFFSETFNKGDSSLGRGLMTWRGFFQSVRPTQQGLAVNVDVSTTSFYEASNLAEFVDKLLQKRLTPQTVLTDGERVTVRRAIMKLKVTVNYRETPRRYRITGLTREPTRNFRFSLAEGEPPTSIVDFFRNTYQYDIQLLGLPLVTVGGKSGAALPMECCNIAPGQKYNGKLDDRQTTQMLRSACKRPQERQRDVMEMVQRTNFTNDLHARDFGMQITLEMTKVPGRILDPPKLAYGGVGQVKDFELKKGAWNLLGGQRLVRGAKIVHWGLVSFDPRTREGELDRIRVALVRRSGELGVRMSDTTVLPPRSFRESEIENTLRQLCEKAKGVVQKGAHLQLIVIVLPRKGLFYGTIKRLCDTVLNVPTQCCLGDKVGRCESQYLANLVLKINVKAGGQNVEFQGPTPGLPAPTGSLAEPVIMFGADVTHAAPGDDSSPSVAAIVASQDVPVNFQYKCLLSTQPHRQEIIDGLYRPPGHPAGDGMFSQLMKEFYKTPDGPRRKPSKVLYFRDGVSEGQFLEVLSAELAAMKQACAALEANYNPKFTVIVVQKRHHTRCFAADNNTDRNGNVLPGTVVDTKICHPTEFDFYMYSHAGIQGTTRPTHYHVLYDENNFTADALQSLIHSLTFTYARCTRSVSLVPPAFYADLAATRARLYLDDGGSSSGSDRGGDEGGGTGSGSGTSGSSSRQGPPPVRPLPAVLPVCRNGMFFC